LAGRRLAGGQYRLVDGSCCHRPRPLANPAVAPVLSIELQRDATRATFETVAYWRDFRAVTPQREIAADRHWYRLCRSAHSRSRLFQIFTGLLAAATSIFHAQHLVCKQLKL